jgi:(4S)-4-hydroxy-5-phosphonooxypentane-2,3-dione isomerase
LDMEGGTRPVLVSQMGVTMMRKLLVYAIVVAAAAVAIVSALLWFYVQREVGGHVKLADLQFFLDAYKAIGIGFLLTLLGTVIPHVLPEARDRLERFKASRIAYSRAKTSVIYLPERLTRLGFNEAMMAVEQAHRKLHLVETYPEELKKHLHWHPHPDTWIDRNYWELVAIRDVLDCTVDKWSDLGPGQRLRTLRQVLREIERFFGPYNENWLCERGAKPTDEQKVKREGRIKEVLEKAILALEAGYHMGYSFEVPFERHREFIGAALDDNRESVANEPGALRFELIKDPEHPTRFYVNEMYQDEAAFDAHRAGSYYRRFLEIIGAFADGPTPLIKGKRIVKPSLSRRAS